MEIVCPECKKTLVKEKLQVALDCTYMVCKKCDQTYIYYHRTRELIKFQPRIKA